MAIHNRKATQMNAAEHIVECYFRYCKDCFTMTDVKIIGGNNRQCDLLAVNLEKQEQFHVESSVTHNLTWSPSIDKLRETFDRKFRGMPSKREGERTDHAKGKTYFKNILQTYRRVGFDPLKAQRVFVIWAPRPEIDIQSALASYAEEHRMPVQVWFFRDHILPGLMGKISTGNYEDEVLRTLSLLRQGNLQVKPS